MREVYRTLRRVAPTDLGVLFLGETGAGKEVLTNLLHRWSRRANGPLVKVHCAALSETLLASELFGHEKGAFTGADRRKVGKFEQANGGTIFLDEVGEIPLDVQVKLLRVLQEREVDRVGGAEPVPIDVRVVAATNRDIAQMVADGRFREDLYYRLQGIVVQVPPLRERRQEIPGLVEQFRSEVAASGESRVRGFATDAMDELFRREWPGNIRELRNAVYRAMVLATGELVERRDVLAALPAQAGGGSGGLPPLLTISAASVSLPSPAAGSDLPQAAEEVVQPDESGASSSAPVTARPADPAPPSESSANVVPGGVRRDESEIAQQRPEGAGPVVLDSLPPRIRVLYNQLLEKGSIGTQDHMNTAGVSHRTGLRDLQTLVELGLAERVGTRRGARYRPTGGQ
jgi:DNA-binding NtrC family response regulator